MRPMRDPRLQQAIDDGYSLDLGATLRQAWSAVYGSIGVFLIGALLWLAALLVASTIAVLLGLGEALAGALGILAATPVTLGLAMIGARRAAGLPVTLRDLLAYRHATAQGAIVLLVNLLLSVALNSLLGPTLSLLPLVIYGLFTSLALYLVADRGLVAMEAIRASAKLVRHQWARLLLLQLLLSVALAIGSSLFLLGLLWAFPLAMISLGGVYVGAVGLRSAGVAGAPNAPDPPTDAEANFRRD
jgi:uncharacterized membrane protein